MLHVVSSSQPGSSLVLFHAIFHGYFSVISPVLLFRFCWGKTRYRVRCLHFYYMLFYLCKLYWFCLCTVYHKIYRYTEHKALNLLICYNFECASCIITCLKDSLKCFCSHDDRLLSDSV